MAEALQKIKLLAVHCVITGSPEESPTTSPVINIRRRITLRMLLSRAGSGGIKHQRREKGSPDRRKSGKADKENNELVVVRQKLRDFFELSPPSFDEKICANVREGVLEAAGLAGGGGGGGGFGSKRNGDRLLRPLTPRFRKRMIRRGWRPMLVTIPEEKF